jgi:hypothetical protein
MRTLAVLGGIALVLGGILALEIMPAADDGADIVAPRPEPAHPGVVAEPDTSALGDIADTVLERPLFSPDRRLPKSAAVAGGDTETVPRLTGIIVGPDGGRAIFDDGSGRPRIVAEGDRLGRFTLGEISPGQVSLIASEGERVLRPRFANSAEASATSIAIAPIANGLGAPR